MTRVALGLLASLSAMASAAPAQQWTPAQEARLSPAYNRCVDQAAGAMPATIDCTQSEHQIQDAALNRAYKSAMATLGTRDRAALRTKQRGWIRDRDRTCQAASADAGGGQNSDLEQASCLLRETVARTQWLETYR